MKTLTLESVELAAELQQDLGVLGMQAMPQELCTWVTGVDLPLMPNVPLFLVDICFSVSGYKFNCHKVNYPTSVFLFIPEPSAQFIVIIFRCEQKLDYMS